MGIQFVTDEKNQRQLVVIDSASGVSYGGADYFKGDKFFAPINTAELFISTNKCAYVEAPAETTPNTGNPETPNTGNPEKPNTGKTDDTGKPAKK
jgi:hypothetical protein